ncbi:MAG: hypothetical protein MUF64_02850 [Polyangiaceae bacterium]|nr:hypothetical protein [Polyangiaceae bacterium]
MLARSPASNGTGNERIRDPERSISAPSTTSPEKSREAAATASRTGSPQERCHT